MSWIIFWDIDGTLLTTARAGIFALQDAAQEVCGVSPDIQALDTAGLTDHEVAELTIRACDKNASPEKTAEFLRSYERFLPDRLHRRVGYVLPGVVEILDALADTPGVLSLLLTGNTPAGALAKLNHYGLASYFQTGVFCADGDDRLSIARRALSVASDLVGQPVEADSTFVVGDTLHDIRCGHAIGARTIAVASGAYPLETLRVCRPWLAVERLPSPGRFMELLTLDAEADP